MNTTHHEICARAKHVCATPRDNTSSFQRSTSHRALTNLSGGCVSKEGGWKDRRWAEGWEGIPTNKPRQLELYCVLLPRERTEKEKVMACMNKQTLLKLKPFVWASSVDAKSQTFKQLRHKCWNKAGPCHAHVKVPGPTSPAYGLSTEPILVPNSTQGSTGKHMEVRAAIQQHAYPDYDPLPLSISRTLPHLSCVWCPHLWRQQGTEGSPNSGSGKCLLPAGDNYRWSGRGAESLPVLQQALPPLLVYWPASWYFPDPFSKLYKRHGSPPGKPSNRSFTIWATSVGCEYHLILPQWIRAKNVK